MDPMKDPRPLDGVVLHELKQLSDSRGAVLHMLRCDSELFFKFGEVYFSEVNPGAIKAWKRHKKMTQHITVPVGKIQLVLYDDREASPTCKEMREYEIGRPSAYVLIRIPPGIWYGFANPGPGMALLANCADLPHDPAESESAALTEGPIEFHWLNKG